MLSASKLPKKNLLAAPPVPAVGRGLLPNPMAMQKQPLGLFGNVSHSIGDEARNMPASTKPPEGAMAISAPASRPVPNQQGGFDYEAARARLMPQQREPSDLQRIASILMPALASLAGDQEGAQRIIDNMQYQRRLRAEQERYAENTLLGWERDDYEAQRDADLRASSPFTIGRDRLRFDPQTNSTTTIYDGSEDFELYAQELGLEPGTPEYFKAVEDYVLRSSGPSAHERDMSLDDHRTGNDRSLEAYRYGNRLGLEGVRQNNRLQLRNTPQARSAPTRSGGRSRSTSSGARGFGRAVVRAGEPTATGANGETLVVRGGEWVPAE
ncbi:hypothetical protein GCM10023208_08260 [Erythrobacter westpacificensis]|uniref:Uncharacterized protein n=1 Tax=Erythrobacter westpacificensis TaxID=1055231 RepID=A0ABP9K280_9SPHN